jgi:hypothetical protein
MVADLIANYLIDAIRDLPAVCWSKLFLWEGWPRTCLFWVTSIDWSGAVQSPGRHSQAQTIAGRNRADVMAFRILLVVAMLAGFILVAISVRQESLATMPTLSIYMFVGGLGIILTALILSVILVIMSE